MVPQSMAMVMDMGTDMDMDMGMDPMEVVQAAAPFIEMGTLHPHLEAEAEEALAPGGLAKLAEIK